MKTDNILVPVSTELHCDIFTYAIDGILHSVLMLYLVFGEKKKWKKFLILVYILFKSVFHLRLKKNHYF